MSQQQTVIELTEINGWKFFQCAIDASELATFEIFLKLAATQCKEEIVVAVVERVDSSILFFIAFAPKDEIAPLPEKPASFKLPPNFRQLTFH